MNIRQSLVILAALAFPVMMKAQSVEEGIKMYQYERYESAKRILEPFASLPLGNYYLGLSELELGNIQNAKTIFSKFPDDAANMSGLARVAYKSNNAAEGNHLAQIVAEKAKKKDWEPLKYAADAINYTEGGNIQQAIDWYREALKRNDNAATHIALGDAYQKTPGGGGEAMNNYEHVTGNDPKNSLAFSRIGQVWYNAKRYDLALENFQKAKDADPSNPLPYRELAQAYFSSGKYELAKENIEQYLQLSDKSVEDQLRYADILFLSKNYNDAIRVTRDLISKGKDSPRLRGLLAFSLYEAKDTTCEALDHARIFFRQSDPKRIYSGDYIKYGFIHLRCNMVDSAEYYFNKAIAMDTAKNKAATYREIATGYKELKNDTAYAKAGEWFGRIVKEDPNAINTDYFYWGFWNYFGKKYDEARHAFEEMEKKYPDQPSAIYWQARVRSAVDNEGKTCDASEPYERWLNVNIPGYEKKPADLMYAYQYLALCAYNKDDKANLKKYMDEIRKLDPNNDFLKQLDEALKSASNPRK